MNIVIAEDQTLLRDSLKVYLEGNKDFSVIGTVSNGEQAIEICDRLDIDIIIMDVKMPKLNGIEATKQIKKLYPHIKILILTLYESETDILEAIEVGANGYLLKDIEPEALISALKTISFGITIFKYGALTPLLNLVSPLKGDNDIVVEDFSNSEIEVIKLICQGLKNLEIADELGLSLATIKNRVGSILSKTNLNDRTQIVIYAVKNGLLNC
ncbi:response regulator transcription factor [Thiospirochaeta perfilievii]|uniref:Response regulator transcription factor n=1 Tax=Thiospirochaeta perfilievii TaxID=252967 RepID=A0A5C1QCA8_9SPIO|nr:response regulator transcription factor [Thiospirochaeta perfilievii]QEN04549.1 response regulator transcription factor [Thiospirochaeta perfilievii]